MAIQLRHPTLRNMTPMLRELDGYLDLHQIGFALSDPVGLLYSANTLFIEKTGNYSLQTTPLSEILRTWKQKRGPSPDRILDEWLAPPSLRRPGAWGGKLPKPASQQDSDLELFRIPLSPSRSGILYLFQPTHSESPHTLIEHFQILRKSFLLVLLDLLDYAVLLKSFHDTGSEDRLNTVFLSTTPRYQSGSSFLKIETDKVLPGKNFPGTVLHSTILLDNPPRPVVRRGYFSRPDPSGPLMFHLPLFGESSFYGWALFAMSEDTNRKTFLRKKATGAESLSEGLHRIRLDLFFDPLLEKHSESGFYSERGIRQILQDLMSPEGTRECFALVGLSLDSPDGETPFLELLSKVSRKTDLVGRLSSREYVVIVMDAAQGRAARALERLRQVLEMHSRKDYRIRLRLGMTLFPDTPATPLRMIRSSFLHTMVSVGVAGPS